MPRKLGSAARAAVAEQGASVVFRTILGIAIGMLLTACGATTLPHPALEAPDRLPSASDASNVSPSAALSVPDPYRPGVDAEPAVASAPLSRPLTMAETIAQGRYATELTDPRRDVFARRPATVGRRMAQNVVAGGNGESVGLFTSSTFVAAGSSVELGVQLNYFVPYGGNFFHTHQVANNQCFEFGINYSFAAPTLFAYNWCTGGNTPQGFINRGLVGDPGGVLNTWASTGNAGLLLWDGSQHIHRLVLEEVQRANGWHLLAFNWTQAKYVDILGGLGVTGSKGPCCGWAIFENHVAPGTSCNFSGNFSTGRELLYDRHIKALIGNVWQSLDSVPSAGFTFGTKIDCANISGQTDPSYFAPFFSGAIVPLSSTSGAGDWSMTQD